MNKYKKKNATSNIYLSRSFAGNLSEELGSERAHDNKQPYYILILTADHPN